MDLGIHGKRALVMGASQGLGRAIAAALVHEGARVAICARGEAKLREAAQQLGAAAALTCDLSQAGAARQLVHDAIHQLGGVDILVTNTGGPPKGDFASITPEAWAQGFQALWLSAVDAIQAALPGMRERRWGRIVLVTSTSAREPISGLTISNGLRPGLVGLAKSLSREVAADGVTVNAVLPGYTDTDRMRQLGVSAEAIAAQIPARRLGKPEELGGLCAFLASEAGAYITGQAIACDGGFLHSV